MCDNCRDAMECLRLNSSSAKARWHCGTCGPMDFEKGADPPEPVAQDSSAVCVTGGWPAAVTTQLTAVVLCLFVYLLFRPH